MSLTVRRFRATPLKRPNHHELAVLGRTSQLGETAGGERLQAGAVLGPHARSNAYAGAVGLLEQGTQRLPDGAVATGPLDESEADLGLGLLVRSGRGSSEEADRPDHEPVEAAHDVA